MAISQSSRATICVKFGRIEDEVVELEVVVDQAAPRPTRPGGSRPAKSAVRSMSGIVVGAGVLIAFDPAGHLALDVALRLAEIFQTRLPGSRVRAARPCDRPGSRKAGVPGRASIGRSGEGDPRRMTPRRRSIR